MSQEKIIDRGPRVFGEGDDGFKDKLLQIQDEYRRKAPLCFSTAAYTTEHLSHDDPYIRMPEMPEVCEFSLVFKVKGYSGATLEASVIMGNTAVLCSTASEVADILVKQTDKQLDGVALYE